MNEINFNENYWTPIPGYYPYEAYPTGEIRNGRTKRILTPRTIHSHSLEDVYQVVDVHINGKRFTRLVHRLIAMTFLPWPPGDLNEYEVDHLNHDPTRNDFMNLRWLPKKINHMLKENISDETRRKIVERCYEMIK